MPINKCAYSFEDLAQFHFPKYFNELDAKRQKPIQSAFFTREGHGYKRTLKALGHPNDFQGCYVFFEEKLPMYVGISQNVVTRVWNHFNAVNHYGSSLVYKVASERNVIQKYRDDYNGQLYREEFDKALKRIHDWSVIYVAVPCHVSLYLFEVYVAMQYNTEKYNSFETH